VTIEDQIRLKAHNAVMVYITNRRRCAADFRITSTDGTSCVLPSRWIALAFLLAIVRCQPHREFKLMPNKQKR
jgi:hypothetical protein